MKKLFWVVAALLVMVSVGYATYNSYTINQKTIVVGYLPSNHDSALFVAQAKGMFEREDIRVQMVPFKDGPDLIRAAGNNQIDIGYCGITPTLIGIDENKHIQVVAAVNQEGSGIMVGNDSGIENIADFKGKTIAMPKKVSMQDVLLQLVLYKNNVSKEQVNIRELGVPLMPQDLKAGNIDGYVAWEPYVSLAKIEGYGNVFMYSGKIWKDHPCCVIVTTDNFARTRPELLKKFLKIHVEITSYINNHLNETIPIIARKLGVKENVEREAFKHMKLVAIPSKDFIDKVMGFAAFERQIGYIKNNLTKDEIFDLQYLPS